MTKGVYVLKKKVNKICLESLNQHCVLVGETIFDAISNYGKDYPDAEQLKDWIKALESGKKIGNRKQEVQ